jgi:kynurenine formamidase
MWIWLSYVLSPETPGYAGQQGFWLEPDKQMRCGDSCNTAKLKLSNHIGSHVDAPLHFVADGKSVDEYESGEWVFSSPVLIDVPMALGEVLTVEKLAPQLDEAIDADIILFRTGFGGKRETDDYWKHPPGYAPELAIFLKNRYPKLQAIGFDSISLSSLDHRKMGREAHREFLGRGIRIFEDLDFRQIQNSKMLDQVIALPLRVAKSDGGPCTIIAELSD